MQYIEEIKQKIGPIWEKSLQTDFIKELATGCLSEERFYRYIEQDKLYLFSYTKLCAKAIVNAKSAREVEIYAKMIAFVIGTELDTREKNKVETQNQEVKPLPANSAYIALLEEVYQDNDNERIFLVLVNCMLSYDYIFTRVAEEMDPKSYYFFFVKDYLSKDYRDFCDLWIDFLNDFYRDDSEEKKASHLKLLEKASELEVAFWEMAYHG